MKRERRWATVTREGQTKRVQVWREGVSPKGVPLFQSEPAVAGYRYHLPEHVALEKK